MDSTELARKIRLDAVNMVHSSHASHIGSALSCADILAVLYADILKYDVTCPMFVDRDRLILSKGHAGSALYAALAEVGFFPREMLDTYYMNGSKLSGHISHSGVPGVEFSTGSLGHGICVATGIAMAGKMDKKDYRTYVIVGDGECEEGSVWETALFAHKYHLSNYTVIVDNNKLQGMGTCDSVMALGNIGEKFVAFGWNVVDVNGHDHAELKKAFNTRFDNDSPMCIVAHTVKGKGVSFMENDNLWHYRDPQGDAYINAVRELGGMADEK